MSAVEALTRVFLLHEAAARELDEDTDETIKSECKNKLGRKRFIFVLIDF